MVRRIYGWLLALCKLITRHECHERRSMMAEQARWVDASFAARAGAHRRFERAVARMRD